MGRFGQKQGVGCALTPNPRGWGLGLLPAVIRAGSDSQVRDLPLSPVQGASHRFPVCVLICYSPVPRGDSRGQAVHTGVGLLRGCFSPTQHAPVAPLTQGPPPALARRCVSQSPDLVVELLATPAGSREVQHLRCCWCFLPGRRPVLTEWLLPGASVENAAPLSSLFNVQMSSPIHGVPKFSELRRGRCDCVGRLAQ